MKSVLVPVDGSPFALNALRTAHTLLYAPQALSIRVISVQPPILSGNVSRYISAETLNEYYQDEGNKALASARELSAAQSMPVACFDVLVGPVAQTIVDYAREQGCVHIVMGRRGLGLIKGLLLGSVTTQVLSLTDLPVTLVQ